MGAATINQAAFRSYDDDGTESAATPIAAINADWSQDVDTIFRMRFVITETGGGMASNLTPQLEYNLASAGWNPVNATSSVVQSVASAFVSDGAHCTQRVGSGTFVGSQDGWDSGDGLAGGANFDLTSNESETEFCVQILSGDVTDGQTLQLRATNAGTVFTNYNQTPTITVVESGSIASGAASSTGASTTISAGAATAAVPVSSTGAATAIAVGAEVVNVDDPPVRGRGWLQPFASWEPIQTVLWLNGLGSEELAAPAEGAASSTGASTAIAAGASTAAVPASSTGASTTIAAGASTVAVPVSSTGDSTAIAVGASSGVASGAASSTGTATTIGAGASTAAVPMSSTGASTAITVGAEVAGGVDDPPLRGTAWLQPFASWEPVNTILWLNGLGSEQGALPEGAASSTGASTAIAAAASIVAAAASSTGASTAIAVGSSAGASEGAVSSTGVATVIGAGASTVAVPASSTGASTAIAVGAEVGAVDNPPFGRRPLTQLLQDAWNGTLVPLWGAGQGVFDLEGAGAGSSTGSSTAIAAGASTAAAPANSTGASTAVAVGVGLDAAAGAGSSTGASTTIADGASTAGVSGSSTGAATIIAGGASTVSAPASSTGASTAIVVGIAVGVAVPVSGAARSTGAATATAVGADANASEVDVTLWGQARIRNEREKQRILADDAVLVEALTRAGPQIFERMGVRK